MYTEVVNTYKHFTDALNNNQTDYGHTYKQLSFAHSYEYTGWTQYNYVIGQYKGRQGSISYRQCHYKTW